MRRTPIMPLKFQKNKDDLFHWGQQGEKQCKVYEAILCSLVSLDNWPLWESDEVIDYCPSPLYIIYFTAMETDFLHDVC